LKLPLDLLDDFDAATERVLGYIWRRNAVDAAKADVDEEPLFLLAARETAKDCFDCRANFDG
jgi:hypothetical protein